MKLSDPDSLPPRLRRKVAYRTLAVGERLFRRGDTAESFFIVDLGRISLSRPTIENKTAVLQFAKLGDIIGENAIFEATYSYSAIAIRDSRVIVYPKNFIIEILSTHPELIADLLQIMHQKISHFENNLELREIRAAHQRVLQFLIYAAGARNSLRLDLTLHNIARQLGFAPATLSRALQRLENEGSITRERETNVIYLNRSTAA